MRMSVLSIIVRWSFAFSPIVSFYPQLAKQQRTGVDDGYSRGTAFLLISSHSLRLFWWLAQPFDPSLLVQSLCTIVMQVSLHLHLDGSSTLTGPKSRSNSATLFDSPCSFSC